EVPFGVDEPGARAGVPIQAGERAERLSGKVDRVDIDAAARVGYVVDYKYSGGERVRQQLKASLSDEMENFQLPIYLLALRHSLGLEPAGAELLSLKNGVHRFAMGREKLADRWGAPAESTRLGEEEFAAYLARAQRIMGRLIAAARSGAIETRPRD